MDQEYTPSLKKKGGGSIVTEIKNYILHKGIVSKIDADKATTLLALY